MRCEKDTWGHVAGYQLEISTSYVRRATEMNILNIVTSPRKEKSASTAVVNAFLSEYREHVRDVTIDRLDIWQEQLPEFDAEAIDAKYKGVYGETMTRVETATWEKIRELASRFQRADRIVLGVPMWNFSVPYKLKQLIDLSCQRNMLFTFDGEFYGPSLSIDKAFGCSRFAQAARISRARHYMGLDWWRFIDAQRRIRVKVALLDSAVLDRYRAAQRSRESEDRSALYFFVDHLRIDPQSPIPSPDHTFHPHLSSLVP